MLYHNRFYALIITVTFLFVNCRVAEATVGQQEQRLLTSDREEWLQWWVLL